MCTYVDVMFLNTTSVLFLLENTYNGNLYPTCFLYVLLGLGTFTLMRQQVTTFFYLVQKYNKSKN